MYELGGDPKYITAVAEVTTDGVSVGTVFDLAGLERVTNSPYCYSIAEGNIKDHVPFVKFGYNDDVPSSQETVANYTYIRPPSSGGGFGVISTSIYDATTAYGAQTIKIKYLDTGYVEQSTVISLAGTTAAYATANDAIRINEIRIVTAGTGANAFDGGVAIGAISCVATSASTDVYRQIDAGKTRGRSAFFCVPDGKCLYLTDFSVGGVGVASASIRVTLQANYNEDSTSPYGVNFPIWEQITGINGLHTPLNTPIKIGERCDVRAVAYTNQSSGIPVEINMRGWMETC